MTSLCACGQKNDLLQAPQVDDVADQVERVGLDRAQEVEQVRGAAAPESQVDVGDEDACETGKSAWLGVGLMAHAGRQARRVRA